MRKELMQTNMKKWTLRIITTIGLLIVLVIIGIFIFVKLTLNETSISILEEKTQKNYDPYVSILPLASIEDGSIVRDEELRAFYLYSAEKTKFSETTE